MKKRSIALLLMLSTLLGIFSCSSPDDDIGETTTESDQETETPAVIDEEFEAMKAQTTFNPTIYETNLIKTAENTEAGDFDLWKDQVFKQNGNNDDPMPNSLIHSPFHTLTINGITVPVYTARCGKGAHSFAWVDITSLGDFALDVNLTLDEAPTLCVVLPQSHGVLPTVSDNRISAKIVETGSFTFTFSYTEGATVTSAARAPITLMITRAEPLEIPHYYQTVEIEPGYHDNDALEFKEPKTVYIIKKGVHDICSIGLPADSILYIEQGAYLVATERKNPDGSYNKTTVIHCDDKRNVKIISRGLLDCGSLIAMDHKNKHVVNTARSKDILISGLTIINSNTWTICAYSGTNITIERNLLLGYRTSSDGIMMSECVDSAGRYNFVRTGDDAIEFKGTGWWEGLWRTGTNCVFEYNDVWTDKGTGYGLTWENSCDMTDVVFRHNSVGFALPTWTDRNTALDCLLGINAEKTWSNILFEDIEIYYVSSPNVMNIQLNGEGGNLENVTFRNIRVHAIRKNKVVALRIHHSATGGKIKNITLEDIDMCGKILTQEDLANKKYFDNEAPAFASQITVIS